jgi:hypothetical protein
VKKFEKKFAREEEEVRGLPRHWYVARATTAERAVAGG